MILSDGEIREEMDKGTIQISGCDELYIGPSSIDLHLDNKSMVMNDRTRPIKLFNENAMLFHQYDGWSEIMIRPNAFYLLSTVEKIKLSDGIVGFVQGRSSIARAGIKVQDAGFCDAGFEGTITLEVNNFTSCPIIVEKGTRICQLIFARMGKDAIVPYWKKKDQKYQGQSGPTLSRIERDHGKD